jgi:hypothetical protein
MSFLRSKHSGWTWEGRRTPYFGGGGGSPGPSQNTTVTSNIPEYAKPYVTNMFEATQQQLFTGNKTKEGGFDITGFRPYIPYSGNVSDYYAGFSPLQQQAQFEAGAMQQPGQFALGSGLTGSAGIRSLGAANQYAQNVTSPGSMQAYMSPYQQGVTDVAKAAAVREAQMAQQAQNLGAARQGTYGGARQLLANTERERNLLTNLSNIQTQGSQAAYDRALQSQQFGANLGMQGYGQALGAGAQLGQLGATQQAADIARQNQMASMGAQQQALEQSKINQAIQDYATQQQYPLMQLGFMSNMLRGLPMQAATTQTYQAAPSPLSQGLGVLAGAAGAKQAGLFAEGGTIKGLAAGGVTGYANRGMVQANPSSGVVQGIRQKLEMMPPEQLQQVARTSSSEEVRAMAIEILREKQIREQAEAQAEQSIMQDQQRGLPTPVTERVGLPAAPAGAMDMLNAASGGIVAFADEGQVELDPDKEMAIRQKYINMVKQQREAANIGAPKAGLSEYFTKEQASLADAEKQARGYDLLQFGVNLAAEAGSLPYAAAKAGQRTLPGIISRQEGLRGRRGEIAKGLAEVAEGERLMKQGDITAGNEMFEKGQERLSKEKIAGAKTPGNMMAYANNYLAEKVAAGDTRDPAIIKREGMDNYMYLYGQAGPRAATAATTATTNLYDKARDNVDSSLSKNYNSPENKQLRRLTKDDKKNGTNTANTYLQDLYRKEEERLKGGGQKAQAAPTPSGDEGKKPKVIKLD